MTPGIDTIEASSSFSFETLESRTFLSSAMDLRMTPALALSPMASSGVDGYSPAQIKHAYGFDQVTFSNGVKGDGAGQTIAIVDAFNDPNIESDLHTFDLKFGLSDPPSFKKVSQTGGSTSGVANDSGW